MNLVEIFRYGSIDTLCTVKTSLEDGTIRTNEHKVRNTLDAVDVCRDASSIVDVRPVHTKLCCCVDCHLDRLTLPYCDAEDIELLAGILVIYGLEVRDFPLARTAPRSPEVNEDIFSLAYIVRKLHLCIFWLWRNAAGHSHYRVHCKVDERLAFCSVDPRCNTFPHSCHE